MPKGFYLWEKVIKFLSKNFIPMQNFLPTHRIV